MTEFEAALVHEIAGCRAAIERILGVWEASLAASARRDDAPPAECPHPDDRRIDFGVTAGQDDWQCGICGYRTIPMEEGVAV